MKIFDFTNGVKGEELANVAVPNQCGGCIVVKNDMRYKIELKNKMAHLGEVTWRTDADNGFGDLKPETFGVQAIMFCEGHIKCGDLDYWQWSVLGTTDWNREACRKGWLVSTKLGPAFKDQDEAA